MSKQKQTEFETELRKVGSYVNVFEATDFCNRCFHKLDLCVCGTSAQYEDQVLV